MCEYKYAKLRGRIIEKFGSQAEFSKAMRISENTMSRKLNGKVGLSQEDIIEWAKVLDIPETEYGLYFFS